MSKVRLVGDSGRQHESLTTRLRNLIGDYPRGIGILKEFIQNADDAGAKEIKFIADWRTYPSELLPADTMKILMGPALLIYNDAKFTEEDFTAIQEIGKGNKGQKAAKTGRFGLGFNVAYNVTDYPSFVSGELRKMQFFDPHEKTIPKDKNGDLGGCNYSLDDLWEECPDTLKPFELFGFREGISCQGTIFRLPFRTVEQGPQSEICKIPFTQEDFHTTIRPLYNTGGELLLFLKNVLEIQIYEINPGEEIPKPLIFIKTLNTEEVVSSKGKVNQFTLDDMREMVTKISVSSSLPVVTYQHKIQVTNQEDNHIENWLVVNGFFKDTSGEIVNIMTRMISYQESNIAWAGKALPWGGVACRLEHNTIKKVDGKVFCFLPLPEKSGLNFHINGYFDLNSSRQGITSDETLMGSEADRYLWNKLLINHVISQAYAQLIKAVAEEIGATHPRVYYRLWPQVERSLPGIWGDLPVSVYRYLENTNVILTGLTEKWQSITQVKLIPGGWEAIRPPLVVDGVSVPEPSLPDFIRVGFLKAGVSLLDVSPQFIRDRLRVGFDVNCLIENAPKACLRKRQWIMDLMKFCAQSPHNEGEKLKGLPLLLLCDGKLHTIGIYNGFSYVMVGSSKEERWIFIQHPEWFVDPEFAEKTSLGEMKKANVHKMDASYVAVNLSVILPKFENGRSCKWDPVGDAIPNAKWLVKVIRYLAQHKSGVSDSLEHLKKLPLIPDQNGMLWGLGDACTPLIPNPEEKKEFLDALKKLIPIVSGSPAFIKIVREFASSFPNLIWFITPKDLVDTLAVMKNIWEGQYLSFDPKIHPFILDFLSKEASLASLRKEEHIDKLGSLAIYPLQNGAVVRGNEPEVFIPLAKPPEIAGDVKLLEIGPSGQWLELLRSLKFKELDLPNLIYKLLDGYQTLPPKKQVAALKWIRSTLDEAEDYLDQNKGGDSSKNLIQAVTDAELIICTDQKRYSVRKVYSPDNPIILKVLGNRAPIPDMKLYTGNRGHWLEFFTKLGMEETPRAQDLLDYIDSLMVEAQTGDLKSATKSISLVFAHLRNHWEKLSTKLVRVENIFDANISLASALKNRAWLPARYSQNELKSFIGALIPEPRLYQANELALPQNGHRVASQQPIALFSSEGQSNDMLTALGFESHPNLNVVMRHFKRLLDLWKADQSGVGISGWEATLRSIYTYLGLQRVQAELQSTNKNKEFTEQWKDIPCIWDFRDVEQGGKRFWKPKHVFQEGGLVLYPYRIQFNKIPDLIEKGFDTLGRSSIPQFDDYIEILQELSEKSVLFSLDERDISLARYVLYQISDDPSLSQQDVTKIPLLTTTHQLISADQVFVNDTPHFADRVKPGELFLVDPIDVPKVLRDAAKVAYLSNSLEETLLNVLPVENDAQEIHMCKMWEKKIRTKEFYISLIRLINHHDTGVIRPNTLKWLTHVKVEASSQILVGLIVKKTQKKLENSAESNAYFEEKDNKVFLKAQLNRLMEDNLAEKINENLDEHRFSNYSRLAILLSTTPDQFDQILNQMHIRQLPGNLSHYDKLDEQVGFDFPQEVDEINASENEIESDESADETTQVDERDRRKVLDDSKTNETTSDYDQNLPSDSSDFTPSRPRRRSSGRQYKDGTDRKTYPPIKPRTDELGHRLHKHNRNSRIFISGVYSHSSRKPESSGSTSLDLEIGNKAEERVFNYELTPNQKPIRMPHGNEGYDIEVYAADGLTLLKYIEVKGINGSWGEGGVFLSAPQYNFGKQQQDKFWLYVVEYALDDDLFHIYPIQNPINEITEYRFDIGWKILAMNDSLEPAIGLYVRYKQEPKNGKITAIKGDGLLKWLTLQFEDGREEKVFFNPLLMEITATIVE